jgi:hypothetical protein
MQLGKGKSVKGSNSKLIFISIISIMVLTSFSYGIQYSFAGFVNPSISLEKTCIETQPNQFGEIEWTFAITNTGDVALDTITITDPTLGLSDVPFGGTLVPGATIRVTVTQQALAEGMHTNDGTVNAAVWEILEQLLHPLIWQLALLYCHLLQ